MTQAVTEEPTGGLAVIPRRSRLVAAVLQLVKFGAVGGVGVLVNWGVSNLLWLTVLNPSKVASGAMLGTIVATLVTIVVNWIGNRYWAFADARQKNTAREGLEFLIASVIGMLVPLACLWFSRDVLGYHSLLSYNLASNVIGLVLGTIVRFLLYRFWVYAPNRSRA